MIRISDDANGFVNMFEQGIDNPFNMTHMRSGQDDDSETSQFGIGLKAGAISTGDKMVVYTKVNDKYWRVEMDFQEMCERDEDSFSPNVYQISIEEYFANHPFDHGSTIVISSIRPSIYKKTNKDELTGYLISSISNIYNDFIKKGLNIFVNEKEIHTIPDIFEKTECRPFTRNFTIYEYNNDGDECYFMTNETEYYVYDNENNKVKKIDKKNTKKYKDIREIGKIQSTFTLFDPESESYLPFGICKIYRNGRLYGSWTKNGARIDGNKNYNISRIDITHKDIAKKLGLTFNKNISENLINNETLAFNAFISKSCEGLTANKSQTPYKKLFEIAQKNKLNTKGKEPTNDKEDKQVYQKNEVVERHIQKPIKVIEVVEQVVEVIEQVIEVVEQVVENEQVIENEQVVEVVEQVIEVVEQVIENEQVIEVVEQVIEVVEQVIEVVEQVIEVVERHIPEPIEVIKVEENKKMVIINGHIRGKIEHNEYSKMIGFLQDNEDKINSNENIIAMYNLYLKMI